MNVDFTFPSESSESTPVWGAVTGDITNQSDLIALTDTKVDKVADETLLSAADQTKLDNISITQAVNLDTMESDITGKQDTLVSGTNIKTVNSTSLLGSGNIVIGGGGAVWGAVTGDITNQSDLIALTDTKVDKVADETLLSAADQTKLDNISITQAVNLDTMESDITGKQDTLVSGTNIKTVNSTSLLGSGNIVIGGGGAVWGAVTGDITNQSDLIALTDTKVDKVADETLLSAADQTKLDNISITQAVNLDTMESDITGKQDTLVSGTNIKTVNSTSLLGSGNIVIGGGGAVWGAVTGDITNQSDLIALTDTKVDKVADETLLSAADQTKLDNISITQAVNLDTMESDITGKQDTLVSGTNIKTVNSTSLLGSGDIVIGGGGAVWGAVTGDITNQSDLIALTDTKVDKVADETLLSAADQTKLDNISITQAVNLDTMESDITGKQDTLVSGTNIKTVNSTSLLGSGNIVIGGGGAVWGAVTGDITNQSDLIALTDTKVDKVADETLLSAADQTKLDNISITQAVNLDTMESDITGKQDTLVSGTNIKTVNSTSLLGSGDIVIGGGGAVWGAVTGDITNQSDLIALTDTKVDKVADETLLSAADQTKLDNISITQAVNLDTMESDITGKQDTLVSGTNIKTVNSTSLLGSGNIVIGGGGAVWGAVTGDITNQSDLIALTDTKVDKVADETLLSAADQTKLDNISITQAVNLDTMESDITGKQDTLVSGTNIKTVNSTSLLGSGNIVIGGGGGGGGATVNVEALVADKTLVATDDDYQYLSCEPNINVYLPQTGVSEGKKFAFVNTNDVSSIYSVIIYNGAVSVQVLYSQGMCSFIYTGTDWVADVNASTDNTSIGYNANGSYYGAAVGCAAVGSYYGAAVGCAAVGLEANGSDNGAANGAYYGAAVGCAAVGLDHGAAVGYNAVGAEGGAAVGYNAVGASSGAAVGCAANGSSSGAAVGCAANGSSSGAAVGLEANGSDNGAAVGAFASTNNKGANTVAIGSYSKCERAKEFTFTHTEFATNKSNTSIVGLKEISNIVNGTFAEQFLDAASARLILINDSLLNFTLKYNAIDSTAANVKGWKIEGLISSDAGVVSLVGTPTKTVLGEQGTVSTWDIQVSADDTNNSLKLEFKGDASTIRRGGSFYLTDVRV